MKKAATAGVPLSKVITALESFAPLSLAEKWDNVGLLVSPSDPPPVQRIFLTNDLTEPVLEEAFAAQAQLIISYHPPIFAALKRLTPRSPKERIVVRAIENRVAIYSPHTAWDAVSGGVNDWLAAGLGAGTIVPLQTHSETPLTEQVKLSVYGTPQLLNATTVSTVSAKPNVSSAILFDIVNKAKAGELCCMEVVCSDKAAQGIAESLSGLRAELQLLGARTVAGVGQGRKISFSKKLSVAEIVANVKGLTQLSHLRVACPPSMQLSQLVSTAAVCAGSGITVLRGTQVDVVVTGEMSHHDVHEFLAKGIFVILCEHSNSERGYLSHFAQRLSGMVAGVEIVVSKTDADPLVVV
eukprot:TRINITY_DN4391_c0_g1_i10.p1 TRINITY_DN4391_c0_g1~~TRINITY_DN4391_c0_g1_i10.p1  ORF type:complete len:354 (+),score=95.22 TRINITY_DN4391_c0_g1_i10:226-1287(+)